MSPAGGRNPSSLQLPVGGSQERDRNRRHIVARTLQEKDAACISSHCHQQVLADKIPGRAALDDLVRSGGTATPADALTALDDVVRWWP